MPKNEASKEVYTKGTLIERLTAFMIDEAVLLIPLLLIQYIVLTLTSLPSRNIISIILQVILIYGYNILFIAKDGATIGKKMMRLKVVTVKYGKVNFTHAVIRETVGKWISELVFELGYLWVLINKKRQGWHDTIAGTLVVKVDKTGKILHDTSPYFSKKSLIVFIFFFLVWGFAFILLPIVILLNLMVDSPFRVAGDSMSPTVTNGNYILTQKFSYQWRLPKRGDIILFRVPQDIQNVYIRRIIALPQEKVKIVFGKVYINDMQLKEPYIPTSMVTNTIPGGFVPANIDMRVPTGSYFVLADNRTGSIDSRNFGFVPERLIIGKYWFTYF